MAVLWIGLKDVGLSTIGHTVVDGCKEIEGISRWNKITISCNWRTVGRVLHTNTPEDSTINDKAWKGGEGEWQCGFGYERT